MQRFNIVQLPQFMPNSKPPLTLQCHAASRCQLLSLLGQLLSTKLPLFHTGPVTAQSVHRSSLVTSQSPVKQPCFTYTSDPNDALQHSYDMLCSTAQPRARHLRHSCIELCLEGLFELSQSLHLTLPQLTRQPPATSVGLSYDFRQKTGQSLLTDFISVLVVRCARRGLRNM